MARPERFLGFSKDQIQGGLILPSLVGLATWIMTVQAHDSAQQQAAADTRRELVQMHEQIRDLTQRLNDHHCP